MKYDKKIVFDKLLEIENNHRLFFNTNKSKISDYIQINWKYPVKLKVVKELPVYIVDDLQKQFQIEMTN